MKYFFKKKGFTLIELLIVIGIISILLGLVSVSLNGSQARARDVVRKSDLHQIQKALELYQQDSPTASFPADAIMNTALEQRNLCMHSPLSDLAPDVTDGTLPVGSLFDSSGTCDNYVPYIKSIPGDPSYSNAHPKFYVYRKLTNSSYILCSCLENKSDTEGTPTYACGNPAGPAGPDGASFPLSTVCPGYYYVLPSP